MIEAYADYTEAKLDREIAEHLATRPSKDVWWEWEIRAWAPTHTGPNPVDWQLRWQDERHPEGEPTFYHAQTSGAIKVVLLALLRHGRAGLNSPTTMQELGVYEGGRTI